MTATLAPAVSDFVWVDGDPCRDPRARLRAGELPGARWSGQYALHVQDGGRHLLVRDALGVNKLFFAVGADGQVASSNFMAALVAQGHPLQAISSVPSGHVLSIEPGARAFELRPHTTISFAGGDGQSLEACAARFRDALTAAFRQIAAVAAGRSTYVTLSGGLDSTVIAAMACEHLVRPVGLTFVVAEDRSAATQQSDLWHATRVAEHFGIELEVIEVAAEQLVAHLDDVLLFGQDHRDFNVHCGLVNDAVARWLAARHEGGARPLVLTGDGMNELVADYTPVRHRGHRYYDLPELPPDQLRRFLVAGLDSGDREVGIFAARGSDVIQPYLMCAQAVAALPGRYLQSDAAKQELVRSFMGDRVPRHVYERPKVRAQVASSGEVRGTLAALSARGIDADVLTRRFAALLRAPEHDVRNLIRGGLYRFATSYDEVTRRAA
jgi:asparagine synthetase B (glutamine-hydrolysing)